MGEGSRISDRFYFIGVTTARSSIMQIFPLWAELLEIDARIMGMDLPIACDAGVYRRAIERLRDDPVAVGALVTTHKVSVHRHAGDLFEELDRWARLCGEISCISRRDGRLLGRATDPVSSGLALSEILPHTYWSEHPHAEVLCMGAGGSGTAVVAHLLTQPTKPRRIVMTNRRPERLEEVRAIHRQLGGDDIVDYLAVAGEADTDAIVAALAPGSLIINATGAGKDRPGSPMSDAVMLPIGAIAWDFNYRGELRFLAQARRQLPPDQVHDGWRYFIHGWTQVIAEVFGLEMTAERLASLDAAAERTRSPKTKAADPASEGRP